MTGSVSKATVVSLVAYRIQRMRAVTESRARPQFLYPRLLAEEPVLVTLFNGMIVRVRPGDISLDGMKLRTDRITADVLHPSRQSIDIDRAPKTEVAVDLPLPGGELRFQARCRIARFRQVGPDEMEFVLHFVTFEGSGRAILRHYINLCLAPSAPKVRRRARILEHDFGKAQ